MKRAALAFSAALALGGLLFASGAAYSVGQAQEAVVFRFGRPVAVVNARAGGDQAGLHLKWPLADQVLWIDRRILPVDLDPLSATTRDGQRIDLQASVRYRVVNPLIFSRAPGAGSAVGRSLIDAAGPALRAAVAQTSLQAMISDEDRSLTRSALDSVGRMLRPARLGITLVDLEITNVSLAPADAGAAAKRLQGEVVVQAATVRAEGDATKRDLMAQADRDAADVRGEGERQALEARGRGDAERATILSAAYTQDPDFARFFRRLEAYDQALNPQTTTLVLSPQSNAFLKLFGDGPASPRR